MFVAMNNFKVAAGRGTDFEEAWKTRKTYLDGVPGFVRFALLKGDAEGEYISHSTWVDRAAFMAWMSSDAFRKGHAQGSLMGVIESPPQVKLYETVIEQEPARA